MPRLNPSYRAISGWVENQNRSGKDISMIVGAVTYNGDKYHNASLFLEPDVSSADTLNGGEAMVTLQPEYYHKSKLVVLAESNPFRSGPFKFMDKLVRNLAGGIGDYQPQDYRTVFEADNGVKIGTAIC